MFALMDHPTALKDSYLPFLVSIVTAFVLYYVMQHSMQRSSVLSWIIYFSLMAAVFTIFFFMQRWTDKRLNKFALIFFVLAMEYLLLKLMTDSNPVFLADLLKYKMNWTRWNIFTGYTGSTLWILLSNLLFYQAFFKQEKINWLACFVAVLTVIIPMAYSLSQANMSLEKADVINFYSNNSATNPIYSERGELISRTGVWVSVLIIIFTLIKGMTKKTSR
jgi:hypothetical protein